MAAATATTFSAVLAAHGIGGAAKILPVTFLVIVVTVAVYGLSATPVARLVGVLNPVRTRPLLVGGAPWVVELASALRSAGLDILMWAGGEEERFRISQARLQLAPGELLASATGSGAELEGVTAVLLLTDEDDFNALASTVLEASNEVQIYRLGPPGGSQGVVAPFTGSDILFGDQLTRTTIAARHAAGSRITVRVADGAIPAGHDVLFLVHADGRLEPAIGAEPPNPGPGDTVVLLGPATSLPDQREGNRLR